MHKSSASTVVPTNPMKTVLSLSRLWATLASHASFRLQEEGQRSFKRYESCEMPHLCLICGTLLPALGQQHVPLEELAVSAVVAIDALDV